MLTSVSGALARLDTIMLSLQRSMASTSMPWQHHGWRSTPWMDSRWCGSAYGSQWQGGKLQTIHWGVSSGQL